MSEQANALSTPGGCGPPPHPAKVHALTDRLKIAARWFPQSDSVLDVGSSLTELPSALSGRYVSYIAVEPDEAALLELSRRHPSITCKTGTAERLPVDTSSIDTALFLDVLEHTQDDRQSIAELARVVKPGGTLILSVPQKGLFGWLDPQNLAARAHGTFRPENEHRHYSLEEIRSMLGAQFTVTRIHTGGLFLYPLSFYLAHFFRKYFSADWSPFLKHVGDFDNDISWGRWSYNLIVMAVRTDR